jgi:hypothetical protein
MKKKHNKRSLKRNKSHTGIYCTISGRPIRSNDTVVHTKYARDYVRIQGYLVSNFKLYTKADVEDMKQKVLNIENGINTNENKTEVIQWVKSFLF